MITIINFCLTAGFTFDAQGTAKWNPLIGMDGLGTNLWNMRLLIMGPQGSGKGTQATRFASDLGIPTISTGALFRANIAAGTELGVLAKSYTDKGELVPDEVTDAMVRARLAEPDMAAGFILDGYPRNAAQVSALESTLADLGLKLDGVIELTVPQELLVERIAKRAKIEGRADDTPEALKRRLEIYHQHTAPLLRHYQEQGLLRTVAADSDVETVNSRIHKAFAAC
jgi:adenylate kinase